MEIKAPAYYTIYDDMTCMSWPIVEVKNLIYEAYCLPSEVPYETHFGVRISLEPESQVLRVWELSKLIEIGRFLCIDGLEKSNWEEILNWAINSGHARPSVHWDSDYDEDYEDVKLSSGTPRFVVSPSYKFIQEFGSSGYWDSPDEDVNYIAFAYAKYVKGFDGVLFKSNGRGYIFRDRFNEWTHREISQVRG
jgi:hypothetical protein